MNSPRGFSWTASIIVSMCLVMVAVAQKIGPETVTVTQFEPADRQQVVDLNRSVQDLMKDVQLAQAQMDLAQSRLTRINEVQLPALIDSLRVKYKLPKEVWDFDLNSFTFTKKGVKPDGSNN